MTKVLGGLALLLTLGCSEAMSQERTSAPPAGGGATPEEVFAMALEANRQGDLGTLVSLVAPSERGMVFLDVFDGAVEMCSQGAEDGVLLCEVLRRHGLDAAMAGSPAAVEAEYELEFDERQTQRKMRASTIFSDVDLASFAPDLRNALVALGAPDDDPLFAYERLDSLETDGDAAVGQEADQRITFLREGGRWYLSWRALMFGG